MSEDIVFSLSDEVKHKIWESYQRLLRQETMIYNSKNKSNEIRAIRHFRIKYIIVFTNIYTTDKYPTVNKTERLKLEYYRAYPFRINNKKKVCDLVMSLGSILSQFRITKISYSKQNDAF